MLVSGVKTGVSIEASDIFANEHNGVPGEFVITRTGDTTEPLTVNYTVEGTAINGGDYKFLNNSITVPEGETQVTIEINPLDDNLAEGAEDITLRLEPSDDYKVSEENEASASILDLDDDCNDETYGFCYC